MWKRTPYRGPHVPAGIRRSSARRALRDPDLVEITSVTDQRDQEPSEDYSYDLAHEVRSGAERRPHETSSAPRTANRPGIEGTEPDGDYGYDEAHDL